MFVILMCFHTIHQVDTLTARLYLLSSCCTWGINKDLQKVWQIIPGTCISLWNRVLLNQVFTGAWEGYSLNSIYEQFYIKSWMRLCEFSYVFISISFTSCQASDKCTCISSWCFVLDTECVLVTSPSPWQPIFIIIIITIKTSAVFTQVRSFSWFHPMTS